MDINRYDDKTVAQIELFLEQRDRMDPKMIGTLSRLRAKARKAGDDVLTGYVYYHLADAYYSLNADYQQFRSNIRKAIACLIRGRDMFMLARAYNFVGIDALNNGVYDVAFNYYSMGIRIAEELDESYLKCIIYMNMGNLFLAMGATSAARQYVRKSIRQGIDSRHKDDFYYHHNLINMHFMSGEFSIWQGDLKGAKKEERIIAQLEKKIVLEENSMLRVQTMFLRGEIALLEGDDKRLKECLDGIIRLLPVVGNIVDSFNDIVLFTKILIRHHHEKTALTILDAVEKTVMATRVNRLMKIMTDLYISCHEKLGNDGQVMYYLRIQHGIAKLQEMEQNSLYLNSVALVNMIDEIRKEQVKVLEENETLQVQAHTDALTGLPNRLSMNRILERCFEKAWKEKTSVCIEILDVDAFKEYNDTYGHQAGDACLKKIARQVMLATKHKGVHCARYGGDEFVLIYENMDDDQILKIAKELKERVRKLKMPHMGAGTSKVVSISQGLCNSVPRKKNKPWDYLMKADGALYSIKKRKDGQGRGGICLRHIESGVDDAL